MKKKKRTFSAALVKKGRRRRVGWKGQPWYYPDLQIYRKVLGYRCDFSLAKDYSTHKWSPWVTVQSPGVNNIIHSARYIGKPMTIFQCEKWCFTQAKKLVTIGINEIVEKGPLFKTR